MKLFIKKDGSSLWEELMTFMGLDNLYDIDNKQKDKKENKPQSPTNQLSKSENYLLLIVSIWPVVFIAAWMLDILSLGVAFILFLGLIASVIAWVLKFH